MSERSTIALGSEFKFGALFQPSKYYSKTLSTFYQSVVLFINQNKSWHQFTQPNRSKSKGAIQPRAVN